jgi:hypothetical protein
MKDGNWIIPVCYGLWLAFIGFCPWVTKSPWTLLALIFTPTIKTGRGADNKFAGDGEDES